MSNETLMFGPQAHAAPRATPGRSTAAVLWLMILLVFLPIATAHGILRLVADEPTQETVLR